MQDLDGAEGLAQVANRHDRHAVCSPRVVVFRDGNGPSGRAQRRRSGRWPVLSGAVRGWRDASPRRPDDPRAADARIDIMELSGRDPRGASCPPGNRAMFDYGLFRYASKQEVLDKSIRYWNPGKTRFWLENGVDLVMGAREGYLIHDMDGRRLIDLHLNGGIYSSATAIPRSWSAALRASTASTSATTDFPSLMRTELAEMLVAVAPGPAVRDVRLRRRRGDRHRAEERAPRHEAPQDRLDHRARYHGHTGLAVQGRRRALLEDLPVGPARRVRAKVPFNDLDAMEAAIARRRRGLRDHRDDPGDLRLPDAGAGLPAGNQGALRESARSSSPTRCRPG